VAEFIRIRGVRVLHYAKIPESILARVNPGTRYRRRIEASRLEIKRERKYERKREGKGRTKTTFDANDGIYDNLF